MTSHKERILGLVAEGKVSAEEGNELLRALEAKSGAGLRRLFQPFDSLNDRALAAIGVASLLAQVVLGVLLPLRFDGALDVHVAPAVPSVPTVFLDLLAGAGTLLVAFWVASLLVGRRARVLDTATAVLGARAPLVLCALATPLLDVSSGRKPATIVVSVVVLPLVIYAFVLLFQAFRYISGSKGGRLWAGYLGALLVAEVISKVILSSVVL